MLGPATLAASTPRQLAFLLLLGLPVACVAWTVTHEEVFREPREFCAKRKETARELVTRKFFYLFTCEYCFSHYVAAAVLLLTQFQLLYAGWRGFVLAEFALVWVANIYMSIYNRLRLDIKHERVAIEVEEKLVEPRGEELSPEDRLRDNARAARLPRSVAR